MWSARAGCVGTVGSFCENKSFEGMSTIVLNIVLNFFNNIYKYFICFHIFDVI